MTEPKVTAEAIARRAHEIAQSDDRGSGDENWARAEHELRNAAATFVERRADGDRRGGGDRRFARPSGSPERRRGERRSSPTTRR
jgi:Protein of unknown function (DUF2934)